MIIVNRQHSSRLLAVLALAVVVSDFTSQFAVAADEPTLSELAAASREKAAREREAKLRHILSKQTGAHIEVYLKDSDSMYINGIPVSSRDLVTIVRESGLDQAVVTAHPEVLPARITEVKELIQKNGLDDVEAAAPLTLSEIAAASREKAARSREKNLRQVLARQKGDQLNVYLKGALGIYVNGTSVSPGDLKTIVRESGLDHVVITAALEVLPDRVTQVEEFLEKNGVENVESRVAKLTLRELTDAIRERADRNHQANLREILSRQRGDELRVYLRNGIAMYVNGKQISPKTLATIARESGLEKAVISAEQRVSQKRLDEIQAVLKKNGATDITVSIKD